MNVEDWCAQVQGHIDAVVLACSAMIAVSPEKTKVLLALQTLAKNSQVLDSDNSQTQHYKKGVLVATATLVKGVETAQLGEELAAQKAKSGTH